MTVKIKFDGNRLSICGDGHRGAVRGSGGQLLWDLLFVPEDELTEKWNRKRLRVLNKVWDRYHLNDCNAGTREQERFIRNWKKENGDYPGYDKMMKILAENELSMVIDENGNLYTYGSQWKFEPVPKIILDWLRKL